MNHTTYHTLSISRRSVANRLAGALAVTMQIPDGTEFICLLGHGDESSNLAALATWVEDQLDQIDCDGMRDPLTYLIACLERELLSIQEDAV
jgi:hypothetical protein